MEFTLEEILALTGAWVVRAPRVTEGLRPVTLQGRPGPGALVFAMRRGLADNPGLEAMVRAGAAGVVLYGGDAVPLAGRYPGLGVLKVDSAAEAFYTLAAEARRRAPDAVVVGITGSSGKTSTKEFLAAILRQRYGVRATVRSRNRLSDCAGLLLELTGAPDEAVIIEMGFSRVGDMDRMAGMARPLAGVITKVTPDHLDGAGGKLEVVAREKGRLGHHVLPGGLLALHAEDPGSAGLRADRYAARVHTFGEGPGADVTYRNVTTGEDGTRFELSLAGQVLPVHLRTHGAVQAANAAAAAVIAHGLGFTPEEIGQGLAGARPLPRRFTVYRYSRGLTLVDDTWSATPDATMRGLKEAAHLAGARRRVAVLSGFMFLEAQAEALHRQVGARVVACGFEELYLVMAEPASAWIGEGARAAGLAPEAIHPVATLGELPEVLLQAAQPDTLIYCKADQHVAIGGYLDQWRQRVTGAGFAPVR